MKLQVEVKEFETLKGTIPGRNFISACVNVVVLKVLLFEFTWYLFCIFMQELLKILLELVSRHLTNKDVTVKHSKVI